MHEEFVNMGGSTRQLSANNGGCIWVTKRRYATDSDLVLLNLVSYAGKLKEPFLRHFNISNSVQVTYAFPQLQFLTGAEE